MHKIETYTSSYYLTPACYHILPLSYLCSFSSLLSVLVKKRTQVGCNDTMGVMHVELLGTYSHELLTTRMSYIFLPLQICRQAVIALITRTASAEQ